MTGTHIEIIGGRTHNLKDITVRIPLGNLTVITGVSGSGKSSLAFDTLYAEGQRRFVESMSTYARQFIEKMARPDVDQIVNIQPAIAIEQKNSVKNARSTIGTATEIADYLRLLYAKAGHTICPKCNLDVREDTPQTVTDALLASCAGKRLLVIAPVPRSEKLDPLSLAQELVRAGFTRVAVPELGAKKGKKAAASPMPLVDLSEAGEAEIREACSESPVRVVVDRIVADAEEHERIASSVAVAFEAGHSTLEVFAADPPYHALTFHAGFRCNGCGANFPRPEPNLFSFNSPRGACPECSGFGRVIGVDWEKVIPDRTLPLGKRPIAAFNTPKYKNNYSWLKKEMAGAGVPWDKPLDQLTTREWDTLLHGDGTYEGLQAFFDWLGTEKYKVQSRIMLARYRGFTTCERCGGTRLVPEALNVKWAPADGSLPPRTIAELSQMNIRDLLAEFVGVRLTSEEEELCGRLVREILSRLTYLVRVGVGYLTLNRQTRTLSGGEAQRINLATALGTALTQTLYVLDEPTVGLHPRDSTRLLEILRDLRNKGNTIVVVEHDPELILGADQVIDLGPRAGSDGGRVVFSGPPSELLSDGSESLTADYLAAARTPKEIAMVAEPEPMAIGKSMPTPAKRSAPVSHPKTSDKITIVGAAEHNLKKITVPIPLNRWVCVTGVSGSGKTTLVHNVLYQGFQQFRRRPTEDLGEFERIEGLEHIDEIVLIDQSPIGRSVRSNPVTYVKAYDPIRKLLASTREARSHGLTEGSFSFNVKGGRCETCEGTGVMTYDMHFLAEMTLPCEMCGGKKFQPRVLDIRYAGRKIDEILSMTIDDATVFFENHKVIGRRLQPLQDVGLGYLTLGQSTATLSGGEAQRLKLASYLTGSDDGRRTLMMFDEPTTGLHLADLAVLSKVFRRLLARGYSLVIIEHNLEIIRQADWIIDLGPEGGDQGGFVVAQGPPEKVAAESHSHTGRFLRKLG
jgi:excinuclease ABC subunit A